MDDIYGTTPFFDLDDVDPTVIPEADCVDANGKPILANSLTDVLICAEVLLPKEEEQQQVKVLRRLVDRDGQEIGHNHKNPLLNTLMFYIEFPNGDVRKYAANIIDVNLLAQVDPEDFFTPMSLRQFWITSAMAQRCLCLGNTSRRISYFVRITP